MYWVHSGSIKGSSFANILYSIEDTFLSYLKEILGKFGRLILLIDRAVQHYRSVKVRQYLQDNSDRIKVEYLPKGSPEFNAVEECWRQGRRSSYIKVLSKIRTSKGCYWKVLRNKTVQTGHNQIPVKEGDLTDLC